MVICFECSPDTKRALDSLLSTGNYKDYSELLAVAIANQALLHSKIKESGSNSVQLDKDVAPSYRAAAPGKEEIRNVSLSLVPQIDVSRFGVPDLFSSLPALSGADSSRAVASYREVKKHQESIPLANWLFGQYNRLLPVKASCRALARLTPSSEGVESSKAARVIADAANELGLYLKMLDRRHKRSRDDLLATAFPSTSDPEKGKLRYASQFVASLSKEGALSGLPAELQLVGVLDRDKISLTEAGWMFARLPNPLLDEKDDNPTTRFTEEERTFLLSHIESHVPTERFAYSAILDAIKSGNNTPTLLGSALKGLEGTKIKFSPLFYATQRSGALSRMSDLELVGRERDGIRVQYSLTDAGEEFLSKRSRK